MKTRVGYNLDKDGCCRCLKAGGYMKAGLGNCLYHPNDGFGVTCVMEFEMTDDKKSPTAEAKDLAAWFPGNGLTESGDQPE